MEALSSYTKMIEAGLSTLDFPKTPERLYDPLRYFLQIGGKRIRPVLTILGAELFGADFKIALPQALAIETFHNFTLIHDDIMDEAPLRRNQTTVHEKWNRDVAILSGDVLLVKAYQLLAQINPKQLPEALDLFNRTAAEVCEGQQMDMDFEERQDVTVPEYIEMIRLKTSILLGGALTMGAIVANASAEDKKHIYDFGQYIGIAFQIQDDILDLYADPKKFGKQVGGDVIANKKTLLHLTAIGACSSEQLSVLKQLQSEKNLEIKIEKTRSLFDHLGVKESCRIRMDEYYQKALFSLEKVSVNESNKVELRHLAAYLMEREL
ncbi:MAG: polyprenyl synthetase family protein [Crocinitomicaceae bacterium]|nr:polyprenyl synthetase family protein [Crocinitomicaceae bacterium]